MSKIKYTTDGKKVVIIGDLNQTDKIVQEIFVTENGDEIPQGERFVVKSLLDQPAKSWKEAKLEELEARYETERANWERQIRNMSIEKGRVYDALSARVKWLREVAKEPRDERFKKVINLLADFLSDTEKWVVVKKYSDWQLVQFNEDGINEIFERHERSWSNDRVTFDTMRLLSLFGSSNGDISFRVSDYHDGSGSEKNVFFFRSKEEALVFLQSEFDKLEKYEYYDIKKAETHGLIIDEVKLEAYKEKQRLSILEQITKTNKELEDLNSKLEQI